MKDSRHQRDRSAPRGAWVVALALALAIGGHWAVLQTAAWTGMLVEFSRSASVAEAVEKTFDGKHPCSLCLAIKKGKTQEQQQQKRSFNAGDDLKLGLPPGAVVAPESQRQQRTTFAVLIPAHRSYPPLRPPPRA